MSDSNGDQKTTSYTVYKRRWLVLTTVSLLNLSTNALWMSYPAVANVAAGYFNKSLVSLIGKCWNVKIT